MGRPSGSEGSQKTCRLLHTVPAFGRKARRTMPYPSLTPGRAGDVVSHTFCWPKVAWRVRWLALASQGIGWATSSIFSSKSALCGLNAVGLAATHSVKVRAKATLWGTVMGSLSSQPLIGLSGAFVGTSGCVVPDALGQCCLAGLKLSTYTSRDGIPSYQLGNQPVTLAACVRLFRTRCSLGSRSDYKFKLPSR
jgi:hypothetical protein